MNISISYDVSGCSDCPHINTGKTYGNDGRDGNYVYICGNGCFGGKDSWGYSFGLCKLPKVTPDNCPIFNFPALDRVASKLNISVEKLEKNIRRRKVYNRI